jgi:hypothetical protein
MDPETLRAAAKLARSRAKLLPRHIDHRDGMERLGAQRALVQLAVDLEVTASEVERTKTRTKR